MSREESYAAIGDYVSTSYFLLSIGRLVVFRGTGWDYSLSEGWLPSWGHGVLDQVIVASIPIRLFSWHNSALFQ